MGTKQVNISLKESCYEKLKARADEKDRSKSTEAADIVRQEFNGDGTVTMTVLDLATTIFILSTLPVALLSLYAWYEGLYWFRLPALFFTLMFAFSAVVRVLPDQFIIKINGGGSND